MPGITLEDVKYSSTKNKVAGFYHKVYVLDIADIVTFPPDGSLVVGATDAEKLMSLNGSIILKEGAKFSTFEVNTDSGALNYKRTKPKMKAFKTEYTCNVQYSAHNEGVLLGLDRCIIIFATIEGEMFVLGTPYAPCFLEEETGKNDSIANQEKMITLKISAEPFKAKTYTGTVQLTPAPAVV